jgi:hypothetical protein
MKQKIGITCPGHRGITTSCRESWRGHVPSPGAWYDGRPVKWTETQLGNEAIIPHERLVSLTQGRGCCKQSGYNGYETMGAQCAMDKSPSNCDVNRLSEGSEDQSAWA